MSADIDAAAALSLGWPVTARCGLRRWTLPRRKWSKCGCIVYASECVHCAPRKKYEVRT